MLDPTVAAGPDWRFAEQNPLGRKFADKAGARALPRLEYYICSPGEATGREAQLARMAISSGELRDAVQRVVQTDFSRAEVGLGQPRSTWLLGPDWLAPQPMLRPLATSVTPSTSID